MVNLISDLICLIFLFQQFYSKLCTFRNVLFFTLYLFQNLYPRIKKPYVYTNIIDISSLQNGLAPYKTAPKNWHLGSSLIAIRFNLCKSLITFVFVVYGNWFGGFPMSYTKANVIFGKYMKIDSRSFGIAFWRKKVMFFSFAIFFQNMYFWDCYFFSPGPYPINSIFLW